MHIGINLDHSLLEVLCASQQDVGGRQLVRGPSTSMAGFKSKRGDTSSAFQASRRKEPYTVQTVCVHKGEPDESTEVIGCARKTEVHRMNTSESSP